MMEEDPVLRKRRRDAHRWIRLHPHEALTVIVSSGRVSWDDICGCQHTEPEEDLYDDY